MTISVWRFSHLALAVSSFLFIALASVTGIILAFQPISEKVHSYKADGFNKITLAQAIPAFRKNIAEVTDVSIDANQFVTVKGIDSTGKNISVYVNPATGKILGIPDKQNEFFQWVTDLHRSLFLHETGRFFIGLTAFLLLLIAITGTILVVKRQRGWKRFFNRIVRENFAQYYHVVLGRLSLVVIIIIALSGTYLSLVRFGVFTEKKITHNIDFDNIQSEPASNLAEFAIFKNTQLSEVQSIEYPFSDDPEDYFTLKLKDREIVVNQFTGETLSEVRYPITVVLSNLSLDLHTGRTNIIWAIILTIACVNILFFIYSGFAITWKRTRNKAKNSYQQDESRFIILVGSENGSTLRYANAVHQQLITAGEACFLTELNNYTVFPKAEHIIIITATYGLGDPPSNANKFLSLLEKLPQAQPVRFSVVGFGSHAYEDFCRFAFDVHNSFSKQAWASPLLEIHTVNDKSTEQFCQWFAAWSQIVGLPNLKLTETFKQQPPGLQKMSVVAKTSLTHQDGVFLIRFKTSRWASFNSGDLLAIYPANDQRERLYSIGKIGREIQLSVKLHAGGLGSGYLYELADGSRIRARIIPNNHFQFPQRASTVIMISNGTGIAPFLGMIEENNQQVNCHLYCGFREQSSFELYREAVMKNVDSKKLSKLHVAYSREGEKQYVKHLLERDAEFVFQTLINKGILMLCGSLAMQNDVIELLEVICQGRTGKSISYFQSHGQLLMDCY
jgi:sulfite reductase (NADPH) flavoprotein alpha-component